MTENKSIVLFIHATATHTYSLQRRRSCLTILFLQAKMIVPTMKFARIPTTVR